MLTNTAHTTLSSTRAIAREQHHHPTLLPGEWSTPPPAPPPPSQRSPRPSALPDADLSEAGPGALQALHGGRMGVTHVTACRGAGHDAATPADLVRVRGPRPAGTAQMPG